uniref:hypothetical protein n=1 Tax=Bradyrhizobium sp. (strain ORS 278) TaxID=114615 RepID=UPI0002F69A50|nr:hypothetical protein [Bradyrhizobium sp. ORS 278]
MPLPVNAIWFPAARTLLISRNGADSPAFFCEFEQVDQLGPRASGARRRYWKLPEESVTKLVAVDENATSELLGAPDGGTIPLALDATFGAQNNLLLVSYRKDSGAAPVLQLKFLANDTSFADASELHRHARDTLGLGQKDHVEGIWTSSMTRDENGVRIGPARLAWPYGTARLIEVQPPSTIDLLSELELTARTDHYVGQSGDLRSIVQLSLGAPNAAVLLVWRSIFAGRLATNTPNPFLQSLETNVAQYLGWSIPFNRIPPAVSATEQPTARGYFLPKSGIQSELMPPGQKLTLTFHGPLDIDDVAMLCICSQPGEQITITRRPEGAPPPHRPDDENLRPQILCWRATIHGLVPLAWNDIEPKVRAALTERLESELPRTGPGAAAASPTSWANGSAETQARSAAPRGTLVDPSSLFSVSDELRSILDEWFATLDPKIVGRLCAVSAGEPIPFTNIARLLPVAIEGMLSVPSNWTVFERDAEALQKQAATIQHLLDPTTGPPPGHLRGNTRLWRSIRQAMQEQPIFDETQIRLIDAMLPTAAGSLPRLDPGDFHKIAHLLGHLAQSHLRRSAAGNLADTASAAPEAGVESPGAQA